jgi:hypothetical protein
LKLLKPEEKSEPQSSICEGHASIDHRLRVEVLWRKQELRVETPEARREKSIVVVGLERGHASIDRGDLGVRAKGGKGSLTDS